MWNKISSIDELIKTSAEGEAAAESVPEGTTDITSLEGYMVPSETSQQRPEEQIAAQMEELKQYLSRLQTHASTNFPVISTDQMAQQKIEDMQTTALKITQLVQNMTQTVNTQLQELQAQEGRTDIPQVE